MAEFTTIDNICDALIAAFVGNEGSLSYVQVAEIVIPLTRQYVGDAMLTEWNLALNRLLGEGMKPADGGWIFPSLMGVLKP